MKGKAKEDFEKWIVKQEYTTDLMNGFFIRGVAFEDFPFSMQSGVLLEFFDSVGIYVDISQTPTLIGKFEYFIWFDDIKKRVRERKARFKTREEALKEAFKKAEEIYNKNKDEK